VSVRSWSRISSALSGIRSVSVAARVAIRW
jgi:hypothetical protein